MKTTTPLKFALNLAMAATLAVIAGCASSGNYEQGSKTAAGLKDSADKITAGKTNIDSTLTALNELVNSSQGDLSPKYKKYSEAVKELQDTAENVRDRVSDMRENGNAYLKAWDEQLAQIKNEDIKNRSLERKAEMQKHFTEIKSGYAEAQMAFKPFMSDLKDIQTALGTDLTSGGLAAIKPTAERTNAEGQKVKTTLDNLASKFSDLGVAMAAAQSAPAK